MKTFQVFQSVGSHKLIPIIFKYKKVKANSLSYPAETMKYAPIFNFTLKHIQIILVYSIRILL